MSERQKAAHVYAENLEQFLRDGGFDNIKLQAVEKKEIILFLRRANIDASALPSHAHDQIWAIWVKSEGLDLEGNKLLVTVLRSAGGADDPPAPFLLEIEMEGEENYYDILGMELFEK